MTIAPYMPESQENQGFFLGAGIHHGRIRNMPGSIFTPALTFHPGMPLKQWHGSPEGLLPHTTR